MVAQKRQTFGIEFVDATCAVAAIAHEASLFENTKMLGDGGARNGQTGGEFVDGARRGAEHFEDGQTGWVAQGRQTVLYVSVHLR